jgi:hypothetical protein
MSRRSIYLLLGILVLGSWASGQTKPVPPYSEYDVHDGSACQKNGDHLEACTEDKPSQKYCRCWHAENIKQLACSTERSAHTFLVYMPYPLWCKEAGTKGRP